MPINIGEEGLFELLTKQLEYNFLLTRREKSACLTIFPPSLARTKTCFQENATKYYRNEQGEVKFSPYHSGQYAIFLYFLSQEA